MSEMRRLLELVRLEKAALQRWLQELETREAQIMRWIEQDDCQTSEGTRKVSKDDELREMVLAARKEGKVCMWVLPNQMQVAPVDEFVRQPADGILYDLNRLEECVLSDGGIRWVNDVAVALVIRKLVEQRDAAEAKLAQQLPQKEKS